MAKLKKAAERKSRFAIECGFRLWVAPSGGMGLKSWLMSFLFRIRRHRQPIRPVNELLGPYDFNNIQIARNPGAFALNSSREARPLDCFHRLSPLAGPKHSPARAWFEYRRLQASCAGARRKPLSCWNRGRNPDRKDARRSRCVKQPFPRDASDTTKAGIHARSA